MLAVGALARSRLPGERGKTEAWVVLDADPNSHIYAGLRPGATADDLRRAVATGTIADHLANFTPIPGDAVLLEAGTTHALGGGVVVFEVQQNSDVTFRLYDWDRVDPTTGKPRTLHVDEAMACIDFARGPVLPLNPDVEATEPALRERLLHCEFFEMWRISGEAPFTVGANNVPRIVVCIEGSGNLESGGASFERRTGDVTLLPAAVGTCRFEPRGAATLLEVSIGQSR